MIVIRPECIGCGHCVPWCPTDSISVYGIAEIDGETCIECKLCISYCPSFMIEEVEG